ncbi:hypothetical protein J1A00_003728 [Escherichia coli]|nr:hypothetical protein [Escherichia coli]
MPAFEWVHVQLHQQKGMISLSPPTICNSAKQFLSRDPLECVLCGGRMVYRRAIAGLNVDGLKKNARDISLIRITFQPADG